MTEAVYDLLYLLQSLTDIGFKIAIIILLKEYIDVRRIKA